MQNLVDTKPRQLGEALAVGPLGFGCWRLVAMSPDDAQARIEAALETGMNLVDTADVYGLDWGGQSFGEAEELLGKVLSQAPQLRGQMVLASKGGIIPGIPYDSGNLAQACEDSLRRLQVEQLDLYQIHRPDLLNHPEDTAEILVRLRAAGKIREVGVSNYTPAQTAALMSYLPFPLVSQQPEFSALQLNPIFDGTFDQAMQHKQTVLAWSPLGGGRLTQGLDGERRQGQGVSPALAEVLQRLAQRESVDVAAIALAFVLAHPCRAVALVGSTQIERIRQTGQALHVQLSRQDAYDIIQASMGESLP